MKNNRRKRQRVFPVDFPELTTSLVFAALCLTASVGVVHLSGFVPTSGGGARAPLPRLFTTMLMIGGAGLTLCLAAVAVTIAATTLGWAFAVVIAGITFLSAPFIVEPLPPRIKDGAFGLALFIAIAAVTLGLGITETWGA